MKKVQHTEKSEISHMSDKPAATGKTIKLKRKVPIAMYAGSLVEQSFTEGQVDSKRNERGGLIWEINGKDDFKVRPFDIKTPKPFVTVNIKEDGTLPDVDVPKHARLRLVARHAITLKQLQDVKNEAVKRWSPHSIVDIEDKKVTSLDIEDNYSKESLRDINVQEELISSFLINKGVTSNSLIEKVFEINKDIEEQIGQEEAPKNRLAKRRPLRQGALIGTLWDLSGPTSSTMERVIRSISASLKALLASLVRVTVAKARSLTRCFIVYSTKQPNHLPRSHSKQVSPCTPSSARQKRMEVERRLGETLNF
jgi:hypothetical protein